MNQSLHYLEESWHSPQMESFIYRLENIAMNGCFALTSGEPGLGKSKTLQVIAHKFNRLDEVRLEAAKEDIHIKKEPDF